MNLDARNLPTMLIGLVLSLLAKRWRLTLRGCFYLPKAISVSMFNSVLKSRMPLACSWARTSSGGTCDVFFKTGCMISSSLSFAIEIIGCLVTLKLICSSVNRGGQLSAELFQCWQKEFKIMKAIYICLHIPWQSFWHIADLYEVVLKNLVDFWPPLRHWAQHLRDERASGRAYFVFGNCVLALLDFGIGLLNQQ